MSEEEELENDEEFSDSMIRKTAVLLALGPLHPIPAMAVLTMALTDILMLSAVSKQGALEAIESITTQLKDNIEFADQNNVGYWNSNSIQ